MKLQGNRQNNTVNPNMQEKVRKREQIGNQQRKAYSIKSAAAQFDASIPFVRKQIKLGKLKAKKCGRKIIILDDDLQSYLENQPNYN